MRAAGVQRLAAAAGFHLYAEPVLPDPLQVTVARLYLHAEPSKPSEPTLYPRSARLSIVKTASAGNAQAHRTPLTAAGVGLRTGDVAGGLLTDVSDRAQPGDAPHSSTNRGIRPVTDVYC